MQQCKQKQYCRYKDKMNQSLIVVIIVNKIVIYTINIKTNSIYLTYTI